MLNSRIRKIKSFFFGQYFSDGLKITFGVLLPSLIFSHFNQLTTGITMSLGAICVSIADNAGPVAHKRNGMLFTLFFICITAVLTGILNQNTWLLAIEIFVLCFFFAMFNVYGQRAASIGTAALLVMILSIDLHQTYMGVFQYALYILAGGIWYFLLSLSISGIMPYRLAQQALGECTLEVADYLNIKAAFYDTAAPIEENYKNLVFKQVEVNQRLENVREIVFKTRKMMKESTRPGRLLVMILVDLVDLFEQSMKTHYEYAAMRENFAQYNILKHYNKIISSLAEELKSLGYSIINNEQPRVTYRYEEDLEKLRADLDQLEAKQVNVVVLKKIFVNIRNIGSRLNTIFKYFDKEKQAYVADAKDTDYSKFVSHQEYSLSRYISNLSFSSSIFRHSLRLAIACVSGYFISQMLNFGQHSYWILLTILVILKPGFSLTKQRNYSRVIGTIAGGMAGILILFFIKDQTARFVLLLIFMVLTYTFQRLKYIVSVLFMTPFVLILFSFVSKSAGLVIARERITDTLIGSAIALLASHFIFPNWEAFKFKAFMANMLKANLNYLQKITALLGTKSITPIEYKLARKEVYIETANLASAFQRMLDEPKRKQKNPEDMHQFVVLNHILSSYLATLSSHGQQADQEHFQSNHLKLIRRTHSLLEEAIRNIEEKPYTVAFDLPANGEVQPPDTPDSMLVTEQLELITKVSADIEKLSRKV